MRDWMGFSPLLNNVTQIEMVGPGGLRLPHSHLQWSHVMKSGDEAVPETGRGSLSVALLWRSGGMKYTECVETFR